MNKWLKIIIIVLTTMIVMFASGAYILFNGLPWKAVKTANEVEQYLEEKYEQDFVLIEKIYNFKDGNYGGKFKPKNNDEVEFWAEKRTWNKEFFDYYPEELWVNQLSQDVKDTIKKTFGSKAEIVISPVYGIAYDLGIDNEIPHYKEVKSELSVGIHTEKKWSEDVEKDTAKRLLKIIEDMQEKEIKVELYLTFETGDVKEMRVIMISADRINTIQTVEDVLNFAKKI